MLYLFSLAEKYRSGHNEPHSKCGVPYGTVGSNPTFSAIFMPNYFCYSTSCPIAIKQFFPDIKQIIPSFPHIIKFPLPLFFKGNIISIDAIKLLALMPGENGETMDKKCSLCGNIYKNQVFRGGFICADCRDLIKRIDIASLTIQESINTYKNKKPCIGRA